MINNEKKDRRVRKTQRLLLNGLIELMEHKSINDITVRELADRVDINRSTFYLHYQDIYDMIRNIETDLMTRFDDLMGAYPAESNPLGDEKELRRVINSLFDFLYENRAICRALLSHNGDIKFLNEVSDNLSKRIKLLIKQYTGNKYTDYDIELVNKYFVNGCIGLVQHWLNYDEEAFRHNDPKHMTELFMELLHSGSGISK